MLTSFVVSRLAIAMGVCLIVCIMPCATQQVQAQTRSVVKVAQQPSVPLKTTLDSTELATVVKVAQRPSVAPRSPKSDGFKADSVVRVVLGDAAATRVARADAATPASNVATLLSPATTRKVTAGKAIAKVQPNSRVQPPANLQPTAERIETAEIPSTDADPRPVQPIVANCEVVSGGNTQTGSSDLPVEEAVPVEVAVPVVNAADVQQKWIDVTDRAEPGIVQPAIPVVIVPQRTASLPQPLPLAKHRRRANAATQPDRVADRQATPKTLVSAKTNASDGSGLDFRKSSFKESRARPTLKQVQDKKVQDKQVQARKIQDQKAEAGKTQDKTDQSDADDELDDEAFGFNIASVTDPLSETPLSKLIERNEETGKPYTPDELPTQAEDLPGSQQTYFSPCTQAEMTDQICTLKSYAWDAPNFHHRPLYFEDVNLERYGQHLPLFQSVASAAHFFSTVPILPYKIGTYPLSECTYTYGYHRPGNCNPHCRHRLPLSGRGLLFQGAAVTGAVLSVP